MTCNLEPQELSPTMAQNEERKQALKAFLRNHAEAIAAIDMCVVPTLSELCRLIWVGLRRKFGPLLLLHW